MAEYLGNKISEIRHTNFKKNYRPHFILLPTLMMIDYVLTWLGVREFGVISEANPLMGWMFDMPFYLSLLSRMVLVFITNSLFIYIYNQRYDKFDLAINFCILSNILVMFAHNHWIIKMTRII